MMKNPPRIWLDYRPIRIGWVIPNRDIAHLLTIATWNTCLWGGRYNCVIPAHDLELAKQLVSCFAVDILLPIQSDDATTAFISRFPHLQLHRWAERIFNQRDCEFADIRHVLILTQQLQVSAFRVFDWMKAFFALSKMSIERSEPGLRTTRLIAQLGGLGDCRVLKIRGVRNLLRKYGVDESFTRSGAIEAIRDIDPTTGIVGFDAFKDLHIEYRPKPDMRPDDVLRYLLERRVFRVGLELTCPNCQLPSWLHLDDVKTVSSCPYCDHIHDVTPQLKDRDWRYKRSGLFGRNDNQLGGVPVALTLQQLSTSLHDSTLMYSTAMSFRPEGAAIEPCESDFVAVVAGKLGISEAPVQIVFGEAKTEGAIDAEDIRKLGKLADALPRDLAEAYILLSKTGTFSSDEIALARTLNTNHRRRVILWSRDELEPYYPYERSREILGDNWHAVSLSDMARITHQLHFS